MKELQQIEETNREIEQVARDIELRQKIRERIQIELDRESDDEEAQMMEVETESMDYTCEEKIEDIVPTNTAGAVNVEEIDSYLLQLEAKQKMIRAKSEQFEAELAIEEEQIFAKEVVIE